MPADARPLCWSGGGTPAEGAEVVLGTGDNFAFTAVEDDQPLVLFRGLQGGVHFFVLARISGLTANVDDEEPQAWPATWFEAYDEGGNKLSLQTCSYPTPYSDAGDGTYRLSYVRILQLDNDYIPAIYGQRVRLVVEVLDAEGRYARSERWVIATEETED